MKAKLLIVAIIVALVIVGCGPKVPQATPTPAPTLDIRPMQERTSELREERTYLVTLKFKKETPLDPFANAMENEWSAEHRTIIVGEKTYNEYKVGAVVSRKADTWDFIFNGNLFTSYVISVEEKTMVSEYFWRAKSGQDTQIPKEAYDRMLQQLEAGNKPKLTVPYAGITVTYVLDKPLGQYVFTDKKPLIRYFVRIEVKNETLTLDLSKLVRNAANTHEIDFEVPKAAWEQTGEFWDPKVSTGSLIIKGHLSTLHGRVIKKWTETDPNFVVVTTKDGEVMVVPDK